MVAEHRPGISEKDPAPGALFNRNFRVIHGKFFRKPVLIVGKGAYKSIKGEHRLGKSAVASSAAKGLRKPCKGLAPFGIEFFNGFLKGGKRNVRSFVLIGNGRVGHKPEKACVFPNNFGTEGMDGSDMSTLHQEKLARKPGILRIFKSKFRKAFVYSASHFCCGKPCEGNYKKSVRIHRIFFVREHADNPFNKNGGFSASRRGRNKYVSSKGIDGIKLITVPDPFSHCHHFLSLYQKIRCHGRIRAQQKARFRLFCKFLYSGRNRRANCCFCGKAKRRFFLPKARLQFR